MTRFDYGFSFNFSQTDCNSPDIGFFYEEQIPILILFQIKKKIIIFRLMFIDIYVIKYLI